MEKIVQIWNEASLYVALAKLHYKLNESFFQKVSLEFFFDFHTVEILTKWKFQSVKHFSLGAQTISNAYIILLSVRITQF